MIDFNIKCVICGAEFIGHYSGAMYCSKKCAYKAARIQQKENMSHMQKYDIQKPKPVEKPKQSIADIVKAAQAAGMTYGQYVSQMHL